MRETEPTTESRHRRPRLADSRRAFSAIGVIVGLVLISVALSGLWFASGFTIPLTVGAFVTDAGLSALLVIGIYVLIRV